MNRLVRSFCAFLLSFSSAAVAQNLGTGLYSFGSFDSRGFDSINIGNLNTHFEIPIVSKTGRGINFNYSIVYDGLIWSSSTASGTGNWQPDPSMGFHGHLLSDAYVGYMTFLVGSIGHCPDRDFGTIISGYTYHDAYGQQHEFNYAEIECPDGSVTIEGDGSSWDGSGFSLDTTTFKVKTRSGTTITAPTFQIGNGGGTPPTGTITDSNGNTINNNGDGTFTDTLGTTALHITGSGIAGSPLVLTYPVTLQADNSPTASATIFFKTYTVQTNFQCSGIAEYGATSVDLMDHITLADASASTYSFTYEATPGVPGAVTGRLASVTLPTQRSINYSYTGGCNGSGINPDGTVGSLTRTTTDGSRSYGRSPVSGPGNATSTTVQDEKGNQSFYAFSSVNGLFYETHQAVYQGAIGGPNLLDKYTCYNGGSPDCSGAVVTPPFTQTLTVTSFNNGVQDSVYNYYDSSGMLTTSIKGEWGVSTLQTQSLVYNPLEEVLQATTYDGSGNIVAQTNYGYDETAPTASSGIPQHSVVTGSPGNQTSSQVMTAPGATIGTTTQYYDTGVPVSTATPNGTTQFSYDSTQTFTTGTTLPTPSSGVPLATSASYDPQSGASISATGMNSGQTAQVTRYDRLLRPVIANLPNGSQINYAYGNANTTEITQSMGNGLNTDTVKFLDGYGRTIRVGVYNGQPANSWYMVDSCYDPTGLLSFQSTKYQGNALAASLQCSGNGTSYTYDALGRMTSSTNADGTATNQYNGRAVKTTDVNGVQKITQYDLLGRISAICEVSSSTLLGESPQTCPGDIGGYTGFVTHYDYDLANHKTTITQGVQQRVFQTDSAGRTIYTSEPERGVTTYSYIYNATGLQVTRTRPQANQTNPAVTTTTTTQYDSLGRPLTITYSDGTPQRHYVYDVTQGWAGFTGTNFIKGNLSMAFVNVAPSAAVSAFNYDSVGQVTGLTECLPSACGNSAFDRHMAYTYDLDGNMTSSSDGAGVTTSYTYSPASEVQTITSSLNDATHPGTLVSNVQNGPNGPLGYSLGNGLTNVSTRDTLGRMNGGYFCNGSSTVNCNGGTEVYGFTNIWQGVRELASCDTGSNQCLGYDYDEFNRLASRRSTSGVTQFTYVYDRYGNRWQQNALQGGPSPQLSFNTATNQISGYAYDAAGNVLNDGFNSYRYDAEGNLIQANNGATFQYTYNALNQQVRFDYNSGAYFDETIFNAQGKFSANWSMGGNFNRAEAYWGSTPIESYFGSPTQTAHFLLRDGLGSMRFETNNTGAVTVDRYTLPFGDGTTTVSGSRNTNDGFAGMPDSPSGNHAQFRDYSNITGRWMQPDPYDGSYDGNNPQSFNRYAYVLNNPLGFKDPSGLFCEYGDDAGDGLLEEVDNNSSRNECERTGGYWVPDGWGSTGGAVSCCDGGGGGGGIPGSGSAGSGPSGGGGGGGGGGSQTTAPNNPTPQVLACKAAYTAGGAAAGALVGAPVGGVVGGVVGGAAGGAGGTAVAPGVGTVVLGAAGAEAGAATGSTAGAWLGGLVGGLAGNALGNIMCSSSTGGSGNYQPNQSHCDAQLEADLNVCRAAKSRACYAQAYVRHDVCSRGLPVPPLNF